MMDTKKGLIQWQCTTEAVSIVPAFTQAAPLNRHELSIGGAGGK